MSGWLDPYLDPSPASRLAGLFDLSSVGTFVDETVRAAIYEVGSIPMPAPPPPPPRRELPAWAMAAASPVSARASAPSPLPTSITSRAGGSPMAVDLSALVAAVGTVGDKVVAYRKADADANLARARLEADARLSEVAFRSGGGAVAGVNLGGVLGSALPLLGLGLGAVVLLKLVKAVR